MTIFERVKELQLPKGKYVVSGSGALEARGIRNAADVDIIATPDLFSDLLQKGWELCVCEECLKSTKKILKRNDVDIFSEFSAKETYRVPMEELIANAEEIQGILFVSLRHWLNWKKASARPKDFKDTELIEEYLAKNDISPV